jgi:Transcription elongation factor, N-terminal
MRRGEEMNSIAPDITPAGLVALEAEIDELETVGRREMAARILAARELGCPGQALPTAMFEVIGIRSEPSAVACGASRSATSSETACWE